MDNLGIGFTHNNNYPPGVTGGEWQISGKPPTMHQRIEELNSKIKKRSPGYYVRTNDTGPLEFELVGPDGEVHYRRDKFSAIEAVALK